MLDFFSYGIKSSLRRSMSSYPFYGFFSVISAYDPDAVLLFDTVGDVPDWFKAPTSDLIAGFKEVNAWDNANFYFIICVPSISSGTNCLIEIKSRTIIAAFNASGGIDAYQSNYRTWGTIDGYLLSTSWLDTNFTPSVSMTLNDSCEVMGLYEAEVNPATSNYNYCAYNSVSQFQGLVAKNNTNRAVSYSYTSAVGASSLTDAGNEGVYISNRLSSTYQELVINGVVVNSIATSGGSLTTRKILLNATNSGAVSLFRNQSRFAFWGSLGSGLSLVNRATLATAIGAFQTAVGRRKSLKTKQVLWDGNSFNAIWYHALQNAVQYELSALREIHWDEYTQSGITLRSIDGLYATNIAPKYNGALVKNIYIINEFTNDYFTYGDVAATKSYFDSLIAKANTSGYEIIACGNPVRVWNGASGTASQTVLNLGLDELNQYLRDQASIQGFTYVEPPSNLWIWRADYASDALYNTACAALYNNLSVFNSDKIHPTRATCINDWSPLIVSAIQNIL